MNLKEFDDDEVKMAKADLYKLSKYSIKIFKALHPGKDLDAWVQAKITKAADYISSVYHYIEYEMKISEYGEQLENSDIYSESVKEAYSQKLMEAKGRLSNMIMEETAYDTFNHPVHGLIKWLNYEGAHMIVKQTPGKPMIVYALGNHNQIAKQWKKIKHGASDIDGLSEAVVTKKPRTTKKAVKADKKLVKKD